jgi:phosphoribosylanthranilate isomerase
MNSGEPLRIKICGITHLEDAMAAVAAGADMLGFNFYPQSPRYIDPAACAGIVSGLGQYASRVRFVGVFVNTPPAEIAAILDQCGLHLAQLSGDEPPEDLTGLDGRAYKALRPKDSAALERMLSGYPPHASPPAWLIDTYHPGQYGGTGQTADWSLAAALARQAPVLLAGGLSPENVGAAVAQVQPWGVDVASGVESTPGRKDIDKMKRFILLARKEKNDHE